MSSDDLEAQESELTLLKSMFTEEELVFDVACERPPEFIQPHMTKAGNSQANGSTSKSNNSFSLHLVTDSDRLKITLEVNFPTNYPSKARPTIFVRWNSVDQKMLSQEIQQFLESTREAVAPGRRNTSLDGTSEAKPLQNYARIWIYSHHIYSHIKRKNIPKVASKLKLNGFFIAGKPACIVVEGLESSCDEFWADIHQWSWQKIQIKRKEVSTNAAEFNKLPTKFSEIELPVSGSKDGKDLKHFLAELGFEQMYFEVLNLSI
uniref:RWD domain-containing protein n=1 Tax=Ditylenchus dipsaci TaxID=166011 RepID=A0A915CUN0_9BILA